MNCENKSRSMNIGMNMSAAYNHVVEAQHQLKIDKNSSADDIRELLALERLRQEIWNTMGIIGMEQMGG